MHLKEQEKVRRLVNSRVSAVISINCLWKVIYPPEATGTIFVLAGKFSCNCFIAGVYILAACDTSHNIQYSLRSVRKGWLHHTRLLGNLAAHPSSLFLVSMSSFHCM